MDIDSREAYFEALYSQPTIGGKHIVAELCHCGHSRKDHLDTLGIGHGACNTYNCSCRKFTWKSWVLA